MGVSSYDPYGPQVVSPSRFGKHRPADVTHTHNNDVSALQSSAEDIKGMAELVSAQMYALRDILARATSAGSATETAMANRKAVETQWWDVTEQESDTKLISYQKTDAYIKRAATRAAAQKKFVTNKNAARSLNEACADLKLASLVLKQQHDEEITASEQLSKRNTKLTDAVKVEHAAMNEFRDEMDPAVETVVRSMAELKGNLERAAVAAARQANETRLAATPRQEQPAMSPSKVPLMPRIEHVHNTFENPPGFDSPSSVSEASPSPSTPPAPTVITKILQDPKLLEELRHAKDRAEDMSVRLRQAQLSANDEQEALLAEMESLRARHAAESAEVSRLTADSEKWRAMYDAVKDDAQRGDGVVDELEAMRVALRRADEKHAREIATLGAEHGASSVDARRALAAAERRVADLEPTLQACEKRVRSLEEDLRSERERRRDMEEELRRVSGDLQRRGRDVSLVQDETQKELAEVSEQLERVKRRANDERETLEKALEAARLAAAAMHGEDGAASATSSWRVANLENELRKASESLTNEREETGRLRGELDRISEQLKVARETSAVAAKSDLPGVVAALEAEVKRLAKTHAAELKNALELSEVEAQRVANLHKSELRHQKDLGEIETRRAEMLAESARAETDGVRAELSRLEQERVEQRLEVARLETEVKRLRGELRHAEEVLAEESKKTAAVSALAAAEVTAATAAMTAAAARGDDEAYGKRRAEIERLRRDAEDNASILESFKDQIEKLKVELESKKRAVLVAEAARDETTASLEIELAAQQKKHDKAVLEAIEETKEESRRAHKKACDTLEAEHALADMGHRKALEVLEAEQVKTTAKHKAQMAELEAETTAAMSVASQAHKNAIAALEAESAKTAKEHKTRLQEHESQIEQLEFDFQKKHKNVIADYEEETAKATSAHRAQLEQLDLEAAKLSSKHRAEISELQSELERVKSEASRHERMLQTHKQFGDDEKSDKERLAGETSRLRAALTDAELALEASNARDAAAEARSSVSEAGGAAAAADARARVAEEQLGESESKIRGLKTELKDVHEELEKTKLKLATLRWRLLGGARSGDDTPAPAPPAAPTGADPEQLRSARQEVMNRDEKIDLLGRTVKRLEAELDAEMGTSRQRRVALEEAETALAVARRDSTDADARAMAANKRADSLADETDSYKKTAEEAVLSAMRKADEAERLAKLKTEEAESSFKKLSEAERLARLKTEEAESSFKKLSEAEKVARLKTEEAESSFKKLSAEKSETSSSELESRTALKTELDSAKAELDELKAELKKLRRQVFDADEKALAMKKKADLLEVDVEKFKMESGKFKQQAKEFKERALSFETDARDVLVSAETLKKALAEANEKNRLTNLADSDSKTKKILEDAEYEVNKAKRYAEDADARANAANARAEEALSKTQELTMEHSKQKLANDEALSKIKGLEEKIEKLSAENESKSKEVTFEDTGKAVTVYPVAVEKNTAVESAIALSNESGKPPMKRNAFDEDVAAAALYRDDYKTCSENISVLSLLVQRAAEDHFWLMPPRRKALQFGMSPNPMARAAGTFMCQLVYPRIVTATWWEYLLFLCAVWVMTILAFCYVAETALSITPGILFAPFWPSFVVLLTRLVLTTEIDFKKDQYKAALNLCHLSFIPIGFMLFFAKLWYDSEGLPWWLVFFFPFVALTKILANTVHDVVIKLPLAEYAALGFGEEGTAYEFAFSERKSGEKEIDLRSARAKDVPYVAKRVWEAHEYDKNYAEEDEGFDVDAGRGEDYRGEDLERGGTQQPQRPVPQGLAAYVPSPRQAPSVVQPSVRPGALPSQPRGIPSQPGFGGLPHAHTAAPPARGSSLFPPRQAPIPPSARPRASPVPRARDFGAFTKR